MTVVDKITFHEISTDASPRIKGRLDASDKSYFVLVDSIDQCVDESKGTTVNVTVCLKVGNKIAFNDCYTGKASLHFTNNAVFDKANLIDYLDIRDRVYLDQKIVDVLGHTLESIISNIKTSNQTAQDSINIIYSKDEDKS